MKTSKKIKNTRNAMKTFCSQVKKNFITMRKKIAKIWVMSLFLICLTATWQSCNVTRIVTTQSEYYQKGDTSVTIQTKTTEVYDATKKFN